MPCYWLVDYKADNKKRISCLARKNGICTRSCFPGRPGNMEMEGCCQGRLAPELDLHYPEKPGEKKWLCRPRVGGYAGTLSKTPPK